MIELATNERITKTLYYRPVNGLGATWKTDETPRSGDAQRLQRCRKTLPSERERTWVGLYS